jgi:hypothetical protein
MLGLSIFVLIFVVTVAGIWKTFVKAGEGG